MNFNSDTEMADKEICEAYLGLCHEMLTLALTVSPTKTKTDEVLEEHEYLTNKIQASLTALRIQVEASANAE